MSLEPNIKRFEKRMYKDTAATHSTQAGYKLGQKMAVAQPNYPLETLINVAHTLKAPYVCKDKPAYRLAFVLGYLKKLNQYDDQDKEQEELLDTLVEPRVMSPDPKPIILLSRKKDK